MLAAAVNVDAIAVVRPMATPLIRIVSGEAPMLTISLAELSGNAQEEGTTLALVKGVLAGIRERGYEIGGFAGTIQAFVKNDAVEAYQKGMNRVFGEGSCHIYKIRKYGGKKVV